MADQDYEIENNEIRDVMRAIAGRIGAGLPEGWGFTLLIFDFERSGDQQGAMFYMSSAQREDAVRVMQEWIRKTSGGQAAPTA